MSPETTVPERVQLDVDFAVCVRRSAGVVRSLASQYHPFGAVGSPITGAHAACPAAKEPEVEPPVKEVGVPHPDAMVNVVPFEMTPGE